MMHRRIAFTHAKVFAAAHCQSIAPLLCVLPLYLPAFNKAHDCRVIIRAIRALARFYFDAGRGKQ
jgi:hypothetical protein